MKNDRLLPLANSLLTLALFGLLIYLPLSACDGTPPCTPKIVSFLALPTFVCGSDCGPGANDTAFYITVEYRRSGKLENPPNPKYQLLKENKVVTGFTLNNSAVGTYQVIWKDQVAADTWYELQAFGDDGTYDHSRLQVQVLPKPYYRDLRMSQPVDRAGDTWIFNLDNKPYSPAVFLMSVENRSREPDQTVLVKYGPVPETSIAAGKTESSAFKDMKLGGNLYVRFNDPNARDAFLKNQAQKDFIIRVYYECKSIPQ